MSVCMYIYIYIICNIYIYTYVYLYNIYLYVDLNMCIWVDTLIYIKQKNLKIICKIKYKSPMYTNKRRTHITYDHP